MKVLVADDDATTRLLLRGTLTKWGYDVVVAQDGAEAWSKVEHGAIRLVVSDWDMPKMNGKELCERIRDRVSTAYVYVLLLTNHDSASYVASGLNAGADDFLSKPFDPLELKARIDVGRRMVFLHDELQAKNAELESLNRRLAQQATTDALTGLHNRRAFDDAIERMHMTACGYGRSYGVLLGDVDDFKRVNDVYGHGKGDEVLRAVAHALRAGAQLGDELFRYGGEEFIALLPTSSAEALVAAGEQWREAVRSATAATTYDGPAVTISFGAATYDGREPIDTATLVQRADSALYTAKVKGRNRVVLWQERG